MSAPFSWARGWRISDGTLYCTSEPPPGAPLPCMDSLAKIPAGEPIFFTGKPGEVCCMACAKVFHREEPPR